MNLQKSIERLEQQVAILADKRDREFYGSKSEGELWFFITHGYFPEAAVCGDEPQIRQFEYAGFRATIILERETCVSRPVEVFCQSR